METLFNAHLFCGKPHGKWRPSLMLISSAENRTVDGDPLYISYYT